MARYDSKKILIIEDDETMLMGLRDNLKMRGADVYGVNDGPTGYRMIYEIKPDLVLLDLMLPKLSGHEICRKVRNEGIEIPIIMLTAKSEEDDLLLGFDVGTDDYVTKPFSIKVLLARITAALRRSDSQETIHSFGDFVLNINSHKLLKNGEEITLMPKEFAFLRYMLTHRGRAISREEILEKIWGDDIIVTSRSVDRCVNTLRSKIEAKPANPVFIKTVRDHGYRFEK